MEIYYETEWYKPPPELKPSLKNQAQRFPARGVNVRRLDHLNLLTSDVAELRRFMEDVLGMRTTEMIVLDSGEEAGVWVTSNNKTYDLAFTLDHYGAQGPLPPRHLRARFDARRSCAPPTSSSRTASTSRPARTSTPSSRRSSSTSTSPAATASRSPTPARA